MKKILLSIGIAFAAFNAYSQQQKIKGFEGLIVEKYYISTEEDSIASDDAEAGALPVGSVTYRIYVDLEPGYRCTGLKGTADHLLKIKTSTSFYNNENTGVSIADNMKLIDVKKNTTMLDSWITMGVVGGSSSGYFGVLKSEDTTTVIVNANGVLKNNAPEMGIPLTQRDGMMKVAGKMPSKLMMVGDASLLDLFDAQNNDPSKGDSLVTNLFSYGAGGGAQGPLESNKVLIGQFTTNGVFSFELNINIQDDNAQSPSMTSLVARGPVNDLLNEMVVDQLTQTINPSTPLTAVVTPLTGAYTAGEVIAIAATTTGDNISSVEFFVDNVSLGAADTQAPYTANYTAVAGTHSVTAKATNTNGSVTSSAVQIVVANKVGLATELEAGSFTVYPNPVTENQFTIETLSVSEGAVYTIYAQNGAVVESNALVSAKQTISVGALQAGEYIVEVKNNGTKSSTRVIKK